MTEPENSYLVEAERRFLELLEETERQHTQRLAAFLDKIGKKATSRARYLHPEPKSAPVEDLETTGPMDVAEVQAKEKPPGDNHEIWLNHGEVLDHDHGEQSGPHLHEGWDDITWTEDQVSALPTRDPGSTLPPDPDRRVVADPAPSMTFEQALDHPVGEEVDLDAAERALERERMALRQVAADSTGRYIGGRHASPDATDPNATEEGRH